MSSSCLRRHCCGCRSAPEHDAATGVYCAGLKAGLPVLLDCTRLAWEGADL